MQRPNPKNVTLNDILSTEALSHALISNLPSGAAFVVDRDLRYMLAEGEALATAGFKPEDFVGRTILEASPPDLAASYEPMYRQALAGEPFEHEHNAHDHTYISRGAPLRAENGEIYAVLVVSYDITERRRVEDKRKRAEAALRESEERFRLFVTASSDMVYRMSADWREMRNLEGKKILVNTEAPSQTWIETYIPIAEQSRVWAAIEAAICTKTTFELEHQVIRQDGTIGWVFSRAIPMLDEQGDIIEWFGAGSDITERKQAEANQMQLIREQAARAAERQRAESLAELDRAKTLFFSNVSHEFRTPLTLSLEPLQDALSDLGHPLDPVHRERLELVHRNNLRLLKLVNTLLDFSRIEAGRMEAVYEPTDLATYTTELASVFRSAIERAGLQLIVDCPPLPESVYVDREMWEKIVLNLLSNAFKFTFEGEITVSLQAESRIELQASTANSHNLTLDSQSSNSELETLTSELETLTSELETLTSELDTSSFELDTPTSELDTPTSELDTSSSELDTLISELEATRLEKRATTSNLRVVLKIRDTGAGIAPEHLPHLFERFYQVRGTQARTHEGSGIGLALVHELVRLHGGTIEVSSTVGEGTCFTIALPFGTNHLPSVRIASPQENRLQPTRTLASTAMGATAYVDEAERWVPAVDLPHPPLERGENSVKVSLLKGDLEGSSGLQTDSPSARVLVADDNADMREYLTRILSEHVQVEAVADGATALAIAQAQVPDLILSDVMMPGLDGFGLLEALRADARTREIPIILLSARAGEEAIVEGLKAGADDYLIKPFSAQELVSRVTTHLQMAQLRSEALQQERIMNRQKDEFISVVSHELSTPLVSILGWTRMLRSSPPNPVMLSKALDTIERNATLQGKLIQDLLDLSRITAGKLRLNPQPIELKLVIETAIATVSRTATDRGIDLTWQENVTEPVVVMGDSDRLSQVLINLLTNSIKFTPESGNIRVELSVGNDNSSAAASCAEIRVTDTGIGIAADFLPYVFDRFSQAQGANTVKGLGLGLAIARHIVELHNGTIHAESAGERQGATFIVRIPLLQNSDDLI